MTRAPLDKNDPEDGLRPTPIRLDSEDYADRYARACDAVIRTLWAEEYGVDENDPAWHTSAPARRVALAVLTAIGLEEKA